MFHLLWMLQWRFPSFSTLDEWLAMITGYAATCCNGSIARLVPPPLMGFWSMGHQKLITKMWVTSYCWYCPSSLFMVLPWCFQDLNYFLGPSPFSSMSMPLASSLPVACMNDICDFLKMDLGSLILWHFIYKELILHSSVNVKALNKHYPVLI